MSLAEFLNDPQPATTAKQAEVVNPQAKLRKQVFLEFAAIVVLGLLLSGWYVAFRIVAGERTPATAAPPVARIPMPAPVRATPVAPAPVPPVPEPISDVRASVPELESKGVEKPEKPLKPPPMGDARASVPEHNSSFKRRDATPRAGEKYLQIAAYGPRALDAYLKTLERQGLHPVVAPGPSDNVYRILIGPFSNSAALEETRHLMQASGIQPILRSY